MIFILNGDANYSQSFGKNFMAQYIRLLNVCGTEIVQPRR